jgi:hypothetical protein
MATIIFSIFFVSVSCRAQDGTILKIGDIGFTNMDLLEWSTVENTNKSYSINLKFGPSQDKRLQDMTSANLGKPLKLTFCGQEFPEVMIRTPLTQAVFVFTRPEPFKNVGSCLDPAKKSSSQ